MRLFLLCLLVLSACAVLPPGYEDELFCPSGSCLQRSRTRFGRGFSGSRVKLNECCDMRQPQTCIPPKPWGKFLEQDRRDRLLKDGYHSEPCEKGGECDTVLQAGAMSDIDERIDTLMALFG